LADVVVLGGGAIGCATALYLAKAGAAVTLVERGELAGEASGAAAGMLAALSDEGGDRGPAFQQLCLDSLRLYDDLLPDLEATGIDLRYRRTGVLHLALTDHEATVLHERFLGQRDLAPGLRWLAASEIAAEEPEASPRAVAALVSPGEHYLDPQRLVLALAEAGRRAGVRVETGRPFGGFRRRGNRLVAIEAGGERFDADAVVLATGAWTGQVAARLHAYVPVRPVRGQMIALRGPGQPLRRVIWGEQAYLVPRENGLTFAGATVEEAGFRKQTTRPAIARLRRGATDLVPGLGMARLASAWAGLRPGSLDGLPVLGLLPGWQNAWVASGHFRNGILLAPISGKLMAESVISGQEIAALEPFSPRRFGE
jgi:glycine oxidase